MENLPAYIGIGFALVFLWEYKYFTKDKLFRILLFITSVITVLVFIIRYLGYLYNYNMIFSLIAPLFALILFKLCNWIIRKTKNRDFIVYISGASLNSEEKKIDKSLDAFLAVCIIAICSYLPITIGINLHDFSISNNSRNAINISVNYADQKSKNKIIRIEPNRIERFYFDYKFDSKMKKSTDLEINIYNIELSEIKLENTIKIDYNRLLNSDREIKLDKNIKTDY
jgi:hypothetical protein